MTIINTLKVFAKRSLYDHILILRAYLFYSSPKTWHIFNVIGTSKNARSQKIYMKTKQLGRRLTQYGGILNITVQIEDTCHVIRNHPTHCECESNTEYRI